MSKLVEITSDSDFHSHASSLQSSALLVISFHAPWAAPCTQMRSLLEAIASTYPAPEDSAADANISFVSVDAESLPDVSESYDVTAVPFLVLQRDGKVLESVSGCDANKVRSAVERHAGKDGKGPAGSKFEIPPMLEVTPRNAGERMPNLAEAKAATNGDANVNGAAPAPQNSDAAAATKPSDSIPAPTPAKNLSAYAPSSPNDPPTAPAMTSAATGQAAPAGAETPEDLDARLASLVKAAPVMLFMKGTPSAPQCGFSRQIVGILRERGVRYGFFNILADEDVRQGLKKWADWPTYPQLWVGGELVGGLDIVREELDSDPDFFAAYAVAKPGLGGMGNAPPDAQKQQLPAAQTAGA